ncbi:MAG: glycine cleavage system protein GcvH [Phycisphaerae bacterium]|jgi:glycine cleavage system H protein|nr:glycine cleavage system protein GcvH [Phycisphaerae bacterium]|tara:strand:+ start:7242 stop:7619 length:378 start_codon:yes stop_codon:yes gene_type:complete
MTTPTDCHFSESHEWYRIEGDIVTVGITQFAANELTDITYVEMQDDGTSIDKGESLGEVESVKTTSDVSSAFVGEIVESNPAVVVDPSLLNSDPYGTGWLCKIKVVNASAENLMDQSTYDSKYSV